jgi:hypothetical protein
MSKLLAMSKLTVRRGSGQSVVELVVALVVCIPILLCIVDLGFIAMGAAANDSVCREASEAAASGPPSTNQAPSQRQLSVGQSGYDRAVSVIKVHQPTNVPAKVSERPVVGEVLIDVPPEDQGGPIDGEVSVTTTVVITPPFLVGVFFGKNGVSLSSKHIAPITYVVRKVTTAPEN